MKINAFAGSGKTTTLKLLAGSTEQSCLYLAFNRAAKNDAEGKFPRNVQCMTVHGLAFRALRHKYKPEKLTNWLNATALAEALNYRDIKIGEASILKARSLAHLVSETIKRFAHSAEESLDNIEVPRTSGFLRVSDDVWKIFERHSSQLARELWRRMIDPEDSLPMGHDGYLKLWALSKPRLPADVIFLDEAQDTNPVVLKVIEDQSGHAQIVFVGDKHQQIYEWRGAINAMETIKAGSPAKLTTSFRFGQEIAAAATKVLRSLGEKDRVLGNPAVASRIGGCEADAILCRTNGIAIAEVIEILDSGKKPHLVGKIEEFIQLVQGAQNLMSGEPATAPELAGFGHWNEVVELVNSGEAEHLRTFVSLVQIRGTKQLLWALKRVVPIDDADVSISTVHKAKGLEWNNVRIASDFMPSPKNRKKSKPPDSEIRLFYVALTRARECLDVSEEMLNYYTSAEKRPEQLELLKR